MYLGGSTIIWVVILTGDTKTDNFKIKEFFMIYFALSIYDMQIEKDYFYHCNDFLHIQDFEKLFLKIDGAFLVYAVLNSNV